MFDTTPSRFAPPVYPRRRPLITGSTPEQSQPQQPVKVPYRSLEQANPSQTADPTPLFFRALPSPAQRQQAAADAARQLAAKSAAPDPQPPSQPPSAPAPAQPPAPPQQTPPAATTSPPSTEAAPRVVATQKETEAQEEAESTLRNPPPTAPADQQPSTPPADPAPQRPSQPPSPPAPSQSPAQPQQTPPVAAPAPGDADYDLKAVEAVKQAAAQVEADDASRNQSPSAAPDQQPSTHSANPAPQRPSQTPTPPAPSKSPAQAPQTPPATTTAPGGTENDPKVEEALKQAAAQAEADDALRKEREPRHAALESAGLGGTASSLEALEDEVRTRHAELVKKFPQRGPEYEAGMKALFQHIQQQQAQIKTKAEQLPQIAARIYQQWGHGVAGNWITEQALREGDKDSPGAPLSPSHLDTLDQEAARYGVDPKDLRHHLEMQRLNDWSRGDTDAAVRHGPGGSIWVNPDRFLDESAYRQAVEQAWGSEAEKAAAMDRFPELQERAAKAQLDVLRTMGIYNRWEAGQPKEMSDADKLAKFEKEHSGILNSGAWKVRMHQALLGVVGAVVGIGKSVVGAYLAATGSHGAMAVYNKLSHDAASISASSVALPTGQWLHFGTSMVVSSLPSLGVGGLTSLTLKAGGAAFGLRTAAQVAQAAQKWGLRGTAATAGLQTFGGMYGDAVQGYMNGGDSEDTALNKAFLPALAGAASTYLLTAAGGTQGVEALLRQPAFKENFRQWFKAVAAGSVKEGLREEAPDQLIQGIIERYTYNPDKPWKEIIEETLHAGIGGALMGGGAEAVTTGIAPAETSQDQPQSSIPSNTTPVAPDNTGTESGDSDQASQPAPAAAKPSSPPLNAETSKKLIRNVEEIQKHRPLNPVEQADLDQAKRVVAEDAAKKASPSGPPLSVATSQALINNVMNRPPEQRGHPTTQADLAQAQWVVQDQVRKLESQTAPLSDAQKKELADAKAALARATPRDRGPLPTVPDARRTIQDLSDKAAASTLNADEAHQLAHAQRAIAQQRVNELAAAEANGTLTAPQKRQLDRFREILAASPYGTELPKGPPPGYDPHAANPAHREWHPPHGDKPVHPADDKFTPEALALPDNEIKTTTERLKAEGHAHDRHGPEVAEGQLADRSMHGIDPISQTREDGVKRGQDHSYSGNATQFTSDRAMVQSLKAVEGSHEFHFKLQAAKAYNSTHATPKTQIKVLGVSLRDALGPNYKEHVRGSTREGFANTPTGNHPTDLTDGSIVAIYRYNPATADYQLHTMYPNPK